MGGKIKLYISSRFKNKQLIRYWVKGLPKQYEVVSTWHDLEDSQDSNKNEAAHRDINEINECDALVIITVDCEQTPGGMHFEAGYACGKGKPIFIIGPSVNIFYDYIATKIDYSFYKDLSDYYEL